MALVQWCNGVVVFVVSYWFVRVGSEPFYAKALFPELSEFEIQ